MIVRTVGPKKRQQRCGVDVIVRRWCCSTHTENEVSSCLGSVGGKAMKICVYCGFMEALWFLRGCLYATGGLPVASQH